MALVLLVAALAPAGACTSQDAPVAMARVVAVTASSPAPDAGEIGPERGRATRGPAPAAQPTPRCDLPLSHWSARRLAGAVMTAPVQLADVPSAKAMVADGIGGVILYGAPREGLARQLRLLRRAEPSGWPLLVASDEEGGRIQRLASLTGRLPWERTLGRRDPRSIRAAARTIGRRLAALGVRVDFAPVADLDAGPGPDAAHPDGARSFSADPAVATAAVVAFARGLMDAGVAPVVKHFPGLGTASANTDVSAATTSGWAQLRRRDLLPFVGAVRAGAPAIMTSNVVVPGADRAPASVSRAITTRILRGELGFRGVVFTDSLSATAIRAAGLTIEQAAVAALRAGVDDVLFGSGDSTDARGRALSIRAAIVDAVRHGRLPLARLRAAADRVAALLGESTC